MARLPYRIDVRRLTENVSDYGDASQATWATIRSQWGDMKPLSGFETLRAGRDTSLVTHVCHMLYYWPDPITAKDRLRHDGDDYDIQWVEEVEGKKRRVNIYCTRVA